MIKKLILVLSIAIGWCSMAWAQQIPSSLESVGIPQVTVSILPTCNTSSPINQTYWITDSTNSCTYGNAIVGNGAIKCKVMCDTVNSTWRMWQAPDVAPPTTVNFMTGTGGGFTNCVSGVSTSGCPTGDGQGPFSNGSVSTANMNVSSASLNLTTGCSGGSCAGAHYYLMQNNAAASCGAYTGCFETGTIASVTNATTFVANAPTTTTGTCSGANMKFTDTGATIFITQDKDGTPLINAATAVAALASGSLAGAEIYIPNGTYSLSNVTSASGPNMPLPVKIQCQDPNNTFLVIPWVDSTHEMMKIVGSGFSISGCTLEGMDLGHNGDLAREQNNWIDMIIASNISITRNRFRWGYGNQGVLTQNFNANTAPPCAYGYFLNASGNCAAAVTSGEISNNQFIDCGQAQAMQFGGGHGIQVHDNQLINCQVDFEDGNDTFGTPALYSSVDFYNNDIQCKNDGFNPPTSCNTAQYTGCDILIPTHNASVNWVQTHIYNNRLHSDTPSGPVAHVWQSLTGGSTGPTKWGNVCTAGDNCTNFAGF